MQIFFYNFGKSLLFLLTEERMKKNTVFTLLTNMLSSRFRAGTMKFTMESFIFIEHYCHLQRTNEINNA